MKQNVIYVNNLNDVATQIGTFDQACEVPLFYGSADNPQPVTKNKGIFNMQTQEIAAITSNNYAIIQHNDAVQAVVETLQGLNMDVAGLIANNNHTIKMDLVFQNQGVPIKDDANGIKIGMRVMNSYNKTTSYRLELFAYRLVCQNGMAFGREFGVQEITFHTGDKNIDVIKQVTEKFIKNAINSSAKLQEYVNTCMVDSVEWDICVKIIEKLLPWKRHQTEIINRLIDDGVENGSPVTRWKLYNAFTNYATHGLSLKPAVESFMETKSKMVFTNTFADMEKLLVAPVATN